MGRLETTFGCDLPFIGLRPFGYSDRKYFFGREDELDALELQVKQNRFVAVVGSSGCGKSSLISAGLRARLENVADPRWTWVEIRPGTTSPLRELAVGLAALSGETGDMLEAWADRVERVLARSSFGLNEALALMPALRESERSRLLLFVDQFEELFRFVDLSSEMNRDLVTAIEHREEATKFVRLLLTAAKTPLLPIHMIVSMRSQFLGHCAGFHGLPEAVSRSQFLVPGMTRNQREEVIRKPIQLAGGRIDPGLVQRALNDTNDDPGQLPQLQHAMMRCWERAYLRGARGVDQPHLTVDDYTKIGGVVSEHCAA
jgi:conflict system STAND superfamily ATPase